MAEADPKLKDYDSSSVRDDLRRQVAAMEQVRQRAIDDRRPDAAEAARLVIEELKAQIVAVEAKQSGTESS